MLKETPEFAERPAVRGNKSDFLINFVEDIDHDTGQDGYEAERTAFSKSLQEKRARIQQLRTFALDMRAVLNSVNELADYAENAQPPQPAEIAELIARVRAEYDQPQTGSTPHGAPVIVESVAGGEYSATAMPGVASPVKITSARKLLTPVNIPQLPTETSPKERPCFDYTSTQRELFQRQRWRAPPDTMSSTPLP
jgi:hypothetical protein